MSYIDETYGKQLEEALRGLVSRPALGQPWFGFHASEVPAGVLLFTATTHSRVLYADFWKYIQDKNLVKTEEEWQSIYNEQGWCPFYSDGDGIDTFRMPSPPLYIKGADNTTVGQYVEAGLPNITGVIATLRGAYVTASGALSTSQIKTTDYIGTVPGGEQQITLDASKSNAIYGNSNTVTPETSKMLFGVWAISAPQQPIPDATVEGIISELGVASNNVLEANAKAETAIDGLNGVVRSVNGTNADTSGNVSIPEGPRPGAIIIWAGNNAPPGRYLLCNGAAVSRTTYSYLFSVIGTTYGEGNGSSTFNLPNLTDKFIQGSGTAGTVKAAGLPNITGCTGYNVGMVTANTPTSGAFYKSGSATSFAGGAYTTNTNVQFSAAKSNAIYGKSSTVQPPALTMRCYIRY